MAEKQYAGVENAPVAGEQEEEVQVPEPEKDAEKEKEEQPLSEADFSQFLEEEEEGELEEGEPEEGEPEEGEPEESPKPTPSRVDPRVEEAFAKRLAQREQQIRAEYERKGTPEPGATEGFEPAPPLPKDKLQALADNLGTTEETANAIYNQQWLINQQQEMFQQQQRYLLQMQEQGSKTQVLRAIEEHRQQNPHLPEGNEAELEQIRQNYYRKTGQKLSYAGAYEKLVAYKAWSGELQRGVQSQVAQKSARKGRASVQAGSGNRARQPSIEEMPLNQFQKMVEMAKQGKFKKG